MNILLVSEFIPKSDKDPMLGGVQSRTYYLAKYLKRHHTVQIESMSSGRIEATSSSLFKRFAWELNLAFFKTFEKKPDIIEASNVSTYIPAYILGKRLGAPVVIWVPDIIGARQWMNNFSIPVALIGSILEKLSFKLKYSKIISLSQQTKNKLIQIGVSPEYITVIPAGIDHELISKIPSIKEKQPTVCSIARLVPYKRVNDLIDAISILKKDIPSIRCWIIGDGPQRIKLEKQTILLKLNKTINFYGSLPHEKTLALLKKAHIFSLPSVVEGFGIVTIEAMACGVPYVSSNIPQTIEVTNNGQGGLLYDANNSKELANKILQLIKDKRLYEKKRKEGLQLASQFDWNKVSLQTEKVYNSV